MYVSYDVHNLNTCKKWRHVCPLPDLSNLSLTPPTPHSLGQSPHHMWYHLITRFRLWLFQMNLTPASGVLQQLLGISRNRASTHEVWPDNIDQSYISLSALWTFSHSLAIPDPKQQKSCKSLTLIQLNSLPSMTLNMLINNPFATLPQIPVQIPNHLSRSRYTTQTLNCNHWIHLPFPHPLLPQILNAHRTNNIHIFHCRNFGIRNLLF